MDINGEDDIKQTPNKEDANSAVEAEDQTPPSPERQERRLRKYDDETEKMKKLFATFAAKTQKQLNEQAERHAIEITAMKQTSMETQNLLTTKTMTTRPVNDHRASANFVVMTKACSVPFDGQPNIWPAFKHQLLNESENPTIGWNQELVNFQLMDTTTKPFNFLAGYFNIPETMIKALKTTLIEKKLKNFLTPDLARDIETSMPTSLRNKDGRIFFIKIISHTFPDREVHKHIIYEYILKLEIIESNNKEAFQQKLKRTHWQTMKDAQIWLNRKKIENIIPAAPITIRIEATSVVKTTTKEHQHHMIVNKITINDLAMIVADHLRMIVPTPTRAARAAQATTTKGITDKAHHSTMTRKDIKYQTQKPMDNQYRSNDQIHTNHTKRNNNSE
jgi:hypothetical protein